MKCGITSRAMQVNTKYGRLRPRAESYVTVSRKCGKVRVILHITRPECALVRLISVGRLKTYAEYVAFYQVYRLSQRNFPLIALSMKLSFRKKPRQKAETKVMCLNSLFYYHLFKLQCDCYVIC